MANDFGEPLGRDAFARDLPRAACHAREHPYYVGHTVIERFFEL
jgi:hypothetical protein